MKLQTIPVLRLYPYKRVYAVAVPAEGSPPGLASSIAKFIKTTGVLRLAYRCDRESALGKILEDSILASARQGICIRDEEKGPNPEDFDIALDRHLKSMPSTSLAAASARAVSTRSRRRARARLQTTPATPQRRRQCAAGAPSPPEAGRGCCAAGRGGCTSNYIY